MYGIKTRGLPGTLAPMYQALQVERSEPPATREYRNATLSPPTAARASPSLDQTDRRLRG